MGCGHYAGCLETQPRKGLVAFRLILLCQQTCLILYKAVYCESVCFYSKDCETTAYLLNGLKSGGIFEGITYSLLNLFGLSNKPNTFNSSILALCDFEVDPVQDLVAQPGSRTENMG